jgi:hypothetical protein
MCEELALPKIQSCIITFLNHPPFMLTQSLAQFYETEPKYVNRAVERNPKRFPADFCFRLTTDDVDILKKNWCQTGTKIYAGETKRPYGFTREGANMLSAVLHTDVAIDRSVQIMRAFSAMERIVQGMVVKLADQFDACKRIAETTGLTGNQAILAASAAVKRLLGYDPLAVIGQEHLANQEQEVHITPSSIGKLLGNISPQKANQLLEKVELQEAFRDAKNKKCWKPTEKGKRFCVLTDTNKKHSDGRPVQQLMWLESVLTVLKTQLGQAEFSF